MTEQQKIGSNSKIIFNTLENDNTNILEKGNIFRSNPASEIPQLRVELNCYAVELKPQSKIRDKGVTSSDSKNEEHIKDLDSKISPSNSISCESFYSCKSSTSLQELKNRDKNDGTRKKSSLYNFDGNKQNNQVSKEELLNQLAMVNALFLTNSVSNCIKNEKSKKKSKEKETLDSVKHEKENIVNSGSTPNKFYSGAFTCQINHDINEKAIEGCGDTIGTKQLFTNQNLTSNIAKGEKITSQKSFQDNSTSTNHLVTNNMQYPIKSSPAENEALNINNMNRTISLFCDRTQKKHLFRKRKHIISRPFKGKRSEVYPELYFANNNDIHDEISHIEKTEHNAKVEIRKQYIIQGYEIQYMEPSYLKNDTILAVLKKSENSLDIECSGVRKENMSIAKTMPTNLQKVSKYLMKNLNEPHLRTLIGRSLSELQSKSGQVSQLYLSLSCKRKGINFLSYDPNDEDIFSNQLQNKIIHSNDLPQLETRKSKFSNEILDSTTSYYDRNYVNLEDSANLLQLTNDNGFDCCNPHCQLITQQKSSGKLKSLERKCLLPVIEEESDESLLSLYSEDNGDEDYCLIDSNGNPIHLFDDQGLPLTDCCGRPLRYANGDLLMKCDKNGIPVINSENFTIFDMFGRHPFEDGFDPSFAPDTQIYNKLYTNDGKPLLLFDIEGRPLTSVSGTMLVDSSGRGLVKVSCSSDHSE